MQQVGKKDKLLKSEIISAAAFFRLGKIISYSLVSQGNINSNYIILTDKGRYILRAYKFKNEEEIISEIDLLNYLSSNHFPCPILIGNIFKTKRKNICCFKYIEGQELKKVNEKELKGIAKLLAKFHLLTRNYRLKFKREGEGLSVIKHYLEIKKRDILKSKFKDSENFINFLETELKSLNFKNDLPSGAVHVDVKSENVIAGKSGKLNLIDFDNFYLDYFVVDIGSTLMWLCADKEKINLKRAEIFLDEYASHRKLTKNEKRYITESIKFNCLKQAFKYAYICLPRLKFAEHWAYYFIRLYKNIQNQEIIIK